MKRFIDAFLLMSMVIIVLISLCFIMAGVALLFFTKQMIEIFVVFIGAVCLVAGFLIFVNLLHNLLKQYRFR